MFTVRVYVNGVYVGAVFASPTSIHLDPGVAGVLFKLLPGFYPHLNPTGAFQSLAGLPRSTSLPGFGQVDFRTQFR